MTLLCPAIRCPKCGKPPSFRIPEEERDAALHQPEDAPKLTTQCSRRGCGTIYMVYARAYQFAA